MTRRRETREIVRWIIFVVVCLALAGAWGMGWVG